MANCVICNAEFNPSWGGSKKLCPKHCAPATSKPVVVAKLDTALGAIMGLGLLVVLSIFLVALIHGCAEDHGLVEFQYPSEVIDHKISIIDGNAQFEVTMKLTEFYGNVPSVDTTSSHIAMIVKHELDAHNTAQTVVFHIVEDTGGVGVYDAYGRPKPTHLVDAFDIEYSMKDLELIDWETVGLNGRWLLDLGTVSNVTYAGDEAIRKYCVDDGQKKYAQVFCADY